MLVAGPHFRLLTLGVPMLVSAAGEVVRYRTRKHFALLIRLALEPGRKFVRDYLIDLLWPDATAERGRHSLSQAITVMRTTVGREFVAAHRNTLTLNEGVIDVDALRLESCDAEIRGRFLEGFDLRGARGFDEWREGWSARLHPKIRDCLVKHMDAARRLGDFATVERHALVLEDLDPLSEDALRGIMEARAWVGDRSNALKAFQRFTHRMEEELGAKPSPELERMAGLLREGRRAAPRPTAEGPPPREERRFEAEGIIGREREFSVLYDAWLEVRQRKPRVMVVLGDPGIGKTTLTNSFVSSCQMEGAVIARAQAYDAERELPYAVLAELVRQLTLQRAIGGAEPEALAELSWLTPDILAVFPGVPSPAEWPPEVVPLRFADAFAKAVTAAADDNPVVLVVDDVHDADNASVGILHMLARKLSGLRLLMILTARSGSLGFRVTAQAMITDRSIVNLSTIELEHLPYSAAKQLVLRTIDKQRIDQRVPVDRIIRLSGGSPLALELLSNEWKEQSGNSIIDQLSHLDGLPPSRVFLPKAIQAWVQRQTELLDDKARAVLDLAAVLGRRVGDLGLYQVIGCSEGEALYQLTKLLDEGLLREVAGVLEFRNELVRAHAYYEIPSVSRLELHKRIGLVLEERWYDDRSYDIEVAWHYIMGRDPKGLVLGISGAEQSLRKGAPREAEQILRQIVAVGPADEVPQRVRLLLSSSLLGQSKVEEAVPILESLLTNPPTIKEELAQSARLYANAMYLRNRNSAGKYREMAERALRVARECEDKELLARALFEWARAGVASGNEGMTREARDELRRSVFAGANAPPAFAFYTDSYCNYFLLDIADAARSADTSVRRFAEAGKMAELELAFTALGNCKLALCQFDEAVKAYQSGLELSRKIGDDCRTSLLCSNLSAAYLLCGAFDQAIDLGEESLQVGERAPAQPVLMKTLANLACAYQLTGLNSKLGRCLESLQDWIQQDRDWVSKVEYCWERAELELSFGNHDEALKLIATADREFEGRGYLSVTQGILERLRVFATCYAEGPAVANRLAQECVARFDGRHVIGYLESLAALAWSERKLYGDVSGATKGRLEIFERVGASGKRASLTMQGFLI